MRQRSVIVFFILFLFIYNLGLGQTVTITNSLNVTTITNTGSFTAGSSSGATITLGNTSGATSIIQRVGSGNFSLDGAAGSAYSIGASATTGTITIGGTGMTSGNTTIYGGTGAGAINLTPGTAGSIVIGAPAGTGAITVGASSAAQTLNLGTGTGASTINIGTGAVVNTILIGNTTQGTSTGLNQSTPTAQLHLGAGFATANNGAPLKFTSGTNLTTAEAGAMEYDGTAFYTTPVASNRGVNPSVYYRVASSNTTLNSVNTAQPAFSTLGSFTVAAATTYEFEAVYYIANGTTTHTTATLFGGTATLTDIAYTALLWSANASTITTAQSTVNVKVATAKVLNATSTSPETTIFLKGIIRINGGGTLIPQIQFSAAPGGTNTMNTNSYFKLTPIGSNTVQSVGNWQ